MVARRIPHPKPPDWFNSVPRSLFRDRTSLQRLSLSKQSSMGYTGQGAQVPNLTAGWVESSCPLQQLLPELGIMAPHFDGLPVGRLAGDAWYSPIDETADPVGGNITEKRGGSPQSSLTHHECRESLGRGECPGLIGGRTGAVGLDRKRMSIEQRLRTRFCGHPVHATNCGRLGKPGELSSDGMFTGGGQPGRLRKIHPIILRLDNDR